MSDPQAGPSFDHLRELLDERDIRYQQRFDAQQVAIKDAFAAAKEAVGKAETSSDARFAAVNEFRQTLADQTASFLTRAEYRAEHSALERRVGDLIDSLSKTNSRLDLISGRSSGMNAGWTMLVGAVGLISTLIAIFYALSK